MTNFAPRASEPPQTPLQFDVTALDRAAIDDPERGDVPGWVLVTVMTAGLVVLLWQVAGPALRTLFNNAMSSVAGI